MGAGLGGWQRRRTDARTCDAQRRPPARAPFHAATVESLADHLLGANGARARISRELNARITDVHMTQGREAGPVC